jgi:hypothetical protein
MFSYSLSDEAKSDSSGDLGALGRLKVETWPAASLSLTTGAL